MPTILIVEDDDNLRKNLIEIFENENFQTIEAKNGEEALQKTKAEKPDIILSDIMMPVMDGYQLLEELQADENLSKIPFIFLTAKAEMENIRAGMAIGADDYVTKPFKIDDLLKTVNARLKKRERITNEVEELKESLVRKIPHELRTPLVGIIGFAEFLEEQGDTLPAQEIKRIGTSIKLSGKRLHRRIEKFLLLAEILAGKITNFMKKYPLDFEYQFDDKVLLFKLRPLAKDFGRAKLLEVKARSVRAKIYEKYFDLIINELLENAIKFSPSDSKIYIIGDYTDQNNYQITFRNYNEKFTEEQFNSINLLKQFDPQNYLNEGVGIGLAIIKKIMEDVNGSFTIKKDSENFVNVTITFPVA
jgi:CheY-like chemotaxis protein